MRGNLKKKQQGSFLYQRLAEMLDPKDPLYKLSQKIPWQVFEQEFKDKYSRYGRPGKPIRLMVSLLILKQMFNYSDESLVVQWKQNPYWQYFSGEQYFQWDFPCDPTELVKFRNRIGSRGAELIFAVSAKLHGRDAMEDEVIADTTCQEKNITYPTDTKLHIKVIKFAWRVIDAEGFKPRQSYVRKIPKLMWSTRYRNRKNRKKEAIKAERKIKTIAGRLVREIRRKLSDDSLAKYIDQLEVCQQILDQKKVDKNKIYSLHEPFVSCIAKGKTSKPYEFGSKVSILLTKNTGVIVSVKNFQGNPYDGHTLAPTLDKYNEIFGKNPKAVIVDDGYRIGRKIKETKILNVHQRGHPDYSPWQWKQRFKRRSTVEAIIGHLKSDYRMLKNYLKGIQGDEINLYMSAAAFNFKKLMEKLLILFKFIFGKNRVVYSLFFQFY